MKRVERRETILLVEGRTEAREGMRDILEEAGYLVLEVEDPSAAAARAEHHGDSIHLLLAPAAMPEVTGHRLAEVLTPLRPEMKVLYIADDPLDAIDSGAYLRRPFSAAALVRRVREILAQGSSPTY